MYYPRHLQSVLQKLSAQFPAVLLTGARQVGKSTLLQHIAPEYGYLTLDDPLLLDQAKNEPQLFLLITYISLFLLSHGTEAWNVAHPPTPKHLQR